jgi:NTP pyrophosphatase (non-canonical NTP hydrolase)
MKMNDNQPQRPIDYQPAALAMAMLIDICHGAASRNGWWQDPSAGTDYKQECQDGTRFGKALVAEKLCLIHSEISEAMEGHRKNLPDDKLSHRSMIEVELADAIIRIADTAGALGLDVGGAIAEKLGFNDNRPDHKRENRLAAGGKAY